MNDYLLLRISEMAIRAIRGITRKKWVCVGHMDYSNGDYRSYFADKYPKHLIHNTEAGRFAYEILWEDGTSIYSLDEDHRYVTQHGERNWFDRIEFL